MRVRHLPTVTGALCVFAILIGSLSRTRTGFLQMQHRPHEAFHTVLFAMVVVLLASGVRSLPMQVSIFLAVALLGVGSEWCEHLRDGYPIERPDVLADTVGAAIGAVLCVLWRFVAPDRGDTLAVGGE